MNCPCVKSCPDRSATCHSSCQAYQRYEASKAIEERRKRKNYVLRCMTSEIKNHSLKRNHRLIYEV